MRIKIKLDPENLALYTRHYKRNGSCSDSVQIQRSNLTLYGNLKQLGNDVKFWRSAVAKDNLGLFGRMKVPGLKGQTVDDVFQVLRAGHCYPYYIGGSVRDQFLNRTPNDADVEVDCSMTQFVKVCIAKWGVINCQYTDGKHVAHIGNTTEDTDLDVMDIGSTNSTFYVPISHLEYTVNSMAYDTNGNDVIIDLTGTGTMDACNGHIRIPSRDNSMGTWEEWLKNIGVVYRFWKLRTKGLVAFNNATQDFIVDKAKQEMKDLPKSFPKFYCTYVYSGSYHADDNKCRIEASKCKSGLANANLYARTMYQDLGEFWTSDIAKKYLPDLSDCKN